jgi:hypothetical protein
MEKLTQPQQLSFNFEEPSTPHAVVSLNPVSLVAQQESTEGPLASPAVVYDFGTALTKRKESAHASLYRQILDSVRHIG